jgi:hypothetical protein
MERSSSRAALRPPPPHRAAVVAPAAPPDADAASNRRRVAELDSVRRLLEARAVEVETAAAAVEREKASLAEAYASKIRQLQEAKAKLEAQVGARRDGCDVRVAAACPGAPTWPTTAR